MASPNSNNRIKNYLFHQKAAEILSESPQRLLEIHLLLDHRLQVNNVKIQQWAQQWKSLIEGLSTAEIVQLLTQKGQVSDCYRQYSPFPILLSASQRTQLLTMIETDSPEPYNNPGPYNSPEPCNSPEPDDSPATDNSSPESVKHLEQVN